MRNLGQDEKGKSYIDYFRKEVVVYIIHHKTEIHETNISEREVKPLPELEEINIGERE